ncbi:hypothetical protein NLG97_g4174 [Lecanicillium saksenae]|uniref:Uncharacterized protein n=1 Tax=Lecanicillium saksenae TaxID=468837 RepID=A0ACC1QWK8_9HYPO|nr:hypothetical protein NLG97_g4174 [Lecanicillium saksenae]
MKASIVTSFVTLFAAAQASVLNGNVAANNEPTAAAVRAKLAAALQDYDANGNLKIEARTDNPKCKGLLGSCKYPADCCGNALDLGCVLGLCVNL